MTVRIGCGAGFAGDRFDAAGPILRDFAGVNGPKYLMFECLAERTLALAQKARRRDPSLGYGGFLDNYIRPHLAAAQATGTTIVTNLGAANPRAGALRIHALARELGLRPPRIAIVAGDDLRETMSDDEIRALPVMDGEDVLAKPILAANAYLGAGPIAEALAMGAEIVLTGRTTDSALALGPLIHEYGWSTPDLLAAGVICGHLLECGAQVTGGYFADPGMKDVPDLAHVGFPIAEVAPDGTFVIGKPANTGGLVTRATVTEQILYEMHDPAAYLTPDATADITGVALREDGPDRIRVTGVRGAPPPATLKATVSVDNGWMAEAEMSYAGRGALARARLAGEIVETRLREAGVTEPIGFDIIGAGAAFGRGARQLTNAPEDGDFRLRLALITDREARARSLVDEILHLFCSGPSAGGGFRSHLTEEVATASVLIPREAVSPSVEMIAP